VNTIVWISDDDAPTWFPPVSDALTEPDGLLAAGGELSPQRLIAAYELGIFPWYSQGQPILWWSPDPRAVLFPDEFHVSRSLARRVRRGEYRTRVDTAFANVIAGCAAPRPSGGGTWLTTAMIEAYMRLHALGYAHSIETWRGEELIGGVYGVCLGRIFFGESMYSAAPDASKVALLRLMEEARRRPLVLIDCQVANAHLQALGSRSIPRSEFTAILAGHCRPHGAGRWT
jgi:leucyl/phenylalanyl-tRNA--protein transferase